jgi:hypothetical protein
VGTPQMRLCPTLSFLVSAAPQLNDAAIDRKRCARGVITGARWDRSAMGE